MAKWHCTFCEWKIARRNGRVSSARWLWTGGYNLSSSETSNTYHTKNTLWLLRKYGTFPPMRGRMCILPVWACFTEETMRQVPHRVTWRLDQRFTGSASFPFRTLNTPESCTRSEPPTLLGFPREGRGRDGERDTDRKRDGGRETVEETVSDPQYNDHHTQTWSNLSEWLPCTIEEVFLAAWDFVNQLSHTGVPLSLSGRAVWLCKWIVANSLWAERMSSHSGVICYINPLLT